MLKDYQDVFGHRMHDYLKNKSGYETVERDNGYFDVGDLKTYFTEYKDWSSHMKEAMRHVRGRVLDIGCGAGRHLLYLREKGCKVFGKEVGCPDK